MPRGRVRIVNGTVVSDCGSLLRGGVAKVYALGKQNGKTAYATDPAYYRQLRNARLNAVRVACLDPWRRTHDQVHWDVTQPDDRAAFLTELDLIVELAAAHELYALIDYHDVGTYNLAYLETFWELVAPRYASLHHVFYELANEPVAWAPEQYTDQALSEQQRLFARVRELAPETHVVLLSFANTAQDLVPQGNPMLDVVERMSGVDWSNASVSFHPYRTLSSQIIVALRERVPVLSTELDLPAHARFSDEPHIYVSMDGAEYAHQALERIGVSWFGWEIEGPRKLEKHFRRGVLMDASIKGYLWKPDWPLRRSLADYSSIARFFREYPVLEAMREMGLEWRQVAGLLRLGCVAALLEGIMLWALLPLSKGVLEGNFQFFWRSAALSPLRPYVPPGAQSVHRDFGGFRPRFVSDRLDQERGPVCNRPFSWPVLRPLLNPPGGFHLPPVSHLWESLFRPVRRQEAGSRNRFQPVIFENVAKPARGDVSNAARDRLLCGPDQHFLAGKFDRAVAASRPLLLRPMDREPGRPGSDLADGRHPATCTRRQHIAGGAVDYRSRDGYKRRPAPDSRPILVLLNRRLDSAALERRS